VLLQAAPPFSFQLSIALTPSPPFVLDIEGQALY
jgi:hypothetical protein